MLEIPPHRLPPEVLDALLEAYVLREGTDYGDREISLAEQLARARRQLASGQVVIVWDEELETCNLLARDDFARATRR